MDSNTTLHFCCGKMAAGKSTLAQELAKKHSAILLIEDYLLSQLFPNVITDIPTYIEYSDRLKTVLTDYIIILLQQGLTTVLDFPGNTKNQRNWFRDIIEKAKVSHTLHYLEVSDEICKQQLMERNRNSTKNAAFTSEADFDAITKYFHIPEEVEGFNVIKYHR